MMSYFSKAGSLEIEVTKSKYYVAINVEQKIKVAECSLIPRLKNLCSTQPDWMYWIYFMVKF